MLEKIPHAVGHALDGVRAGMEALTMADARLACAATLTVESDDFDHGGAIPRACTADGEGRSPSLAWRGAPTTAVAIALIVEDADSPTPKPLVHAIAVNLAVEERLEANALNAAGDDVVGRNSYLQNKWLPPDPPPGHGPHRYVFQVFALDVATTLEGAPGRSGFVDAIAGHVVASGMLVGVYERM